ncbi:hypothetical protein DL240_04735 [Lujinxingia litoralis]|uniref:Uncharacterized protein n=1 Tax=Lujinxingia litoralis TaxID=2211119 RepID=A0A328CCU7_9DELT|nr:hypothetical protein [Lujinxingia litoralis]RAL25520.1 hypothetical protein DL240_04735 [Lujinxingia litoralis]
MIRELIGVKLRMVRGTLRSDEGRLRGPFFAVLSLLFAAALFRSGHFIVTQSLMLEPVGELLVQRLLAITLLVFFGLLIFSNIVTSFSSFYLADDLEFLMAQPIPKDQLFTSRYLEAMLQSSWVIILFGVPLFSAIGYGMGAHWSFYPYLLLMLLPFVAIPTGVASILALLVTNILAANRTRDAALFFGLVGFTTLFVVIRSVQPERLLNPESFDSIGELMRLLSVPTTSYLPSDWVISMLAGPLFGREVDLLWPASFLFLTPLALYFVAAWLHRPLYFRGYTKTQEGRHGGGLMTRARNWAVERSTRAGGTLAERLEALGARGPQALNSLRALVHKDQAIFTRDASQWSQLLIVVAIIVIYLVNFKYFEIAADEALLGDVGLNFFNLAACSFVTVTLCGRFLFPAVSVEGRSFWLILQAPITLERFLVGKWLGSLLPIVILGQALIWSSNLLVGTPLLTCLLSSLQILIITTICAALAVGMGALYPQFHNPNAAKIASSFGAVIFMISCIFLTLMLLGMWFYPTMALTQPQRFGNLGLTTWALAGLGVVIAAAVPAVAIKAGARALRARF